MTAYWRRRWSPPLQRRRLPIPHDAPAPPSGGLDGLRQAAAASSPCMSPTIAVLPIHERGALYDRGRRSVRCYGLQRGLSPPALACGGAWGEHGARRRRRGESLKSGFLFPIRTRALEQFLR